MAEIVQSLFGVTPQMYQQQQSDAADARAMQYARLSPFEQANFAIGRGASQLVGALGGQDPQLQMISARNQIAQQIDYNSPESIAAAVRRLSEIGDSQGAMMLADVGRKAQSEQALAGQRNAAAKASTAAAAASSAEKAPKPVVVGNALVDPVSGREIYKGPDAQKYSGFAQELIDAGLTPGTEPFQRRMLDHVEAKTKGAAKGQGNVSVSVGGISLNPAKAGEAASKVIGENVANIENQFSLQTAIKDAANLIDKGIYAGAYGPEQGFVAKFTGIGSRDKVINTEQFFANIGEIVIPRLVQFGGNDSNEELKYLQRVVAGDQRLEPEAMKRILASAEKKIQKNIARLQKQAGGGELPTGAMPDAAPAPATPKPTKRYNPQTRQLEAISGD